MGEIAGAQPGVCGTQACRLSIEHMWPAAQRWFSGASIPGSGPLVSWNSVPKEYKDGVQEGNACRKCGGPLLRESGLPDLGACSCGRKNTESDFDRSFCSCGTPTNLSEDTKLRYLKQQHVSDFLRFARSLQEGSGN